MLNLRGFVRISGSIKRTSRLSTKCAHSLLRTVAFSTGTMAAKIQGIYSRVLRYVWSVALPQPRGANVSPTLVSLPPREQEIQ